MTRYLPIVLGLAVGVVCVRLGIWQLDRLAQRRAFNATRTERMALPVLDLDTLPSLPADSLVGRRAVARGRWRFAQQTLERARSHRGAPGAFVLTPLELANGTIVLVNRGWTYAADGRTVDLAALGEPDTVTIRGVLLAPRTDRLGVDPRDVVPGPTTLPVLLRRVDPPDSLPAGLVLLDVPPLSEGPHLSYAMQWFAFATVAVVGGIILYRKHAHAA